MSRLFSLMSHVNVRLVVQTTTFISSHKFFYPINILKAETNSDKKVIYGNLINTKIYF